MSVARSLDLREPLYFSVKDGEAISLLLTDSAFMSFYNAGIKIGWGLQFDPLKIDASHFAAILQKIEDSICCPMSSAEVKIVVNPSRKLQMEQLAERLKSGTLQFAERENSTRFFYLPAEGRIRLPKMTIQSVTPEIKKRSRVLIVDDSATIRKLLEKIFSTDSDLEVVGTCEHPSLAEDMIRRLKPDVITMDIHMPDMDGVTLLKRILPKYHIPTVMITSVSKEEGPLVFEALEAGAVDYIQKPSLKELDSVIQTILDKVKSAAQAKVRTTISSLSTFVSETDWVTTNKLIAIGSSTGGTEALKEIFTRFPNVFPPVVVVQHIPALFSTALARRLNELCRFSVKEAQDQEPLVPSTVYFAPGGRQLKVKSSGGKLFAVVYDETREMRYKPCVDVLFDSVVPLGSQVVGVLLTGMGSDGADGLLKIRQAGGHTVVQDENSCVVFGMPREAIKRGAAEEVKDLYQIPAQLSKWLKAR